VGAPAGRHAHADTPATGYCHATPDGDPLACNVRTHNDAEAYFDALTAGDLYALAAADHHEWCVNQSGPEGAPRGAGGSGSPGSRGAAPMGGRPGDRGPCLRPGGGVADLGASREAEVIP
jgi:hypothetical protein